MIAEIIKVLKCNDFYNAGKYTEIAKGKYEMVHTWSNFLRKLKRKQK